MTDPVEIVARALCWHSEIGAWSPPEVHDADCRWVEDHWIDWENEARTALTALRDAGWALVSREATGALYAAGRAAMDADEGVSDTWRVMLDAGEWKP